MYLSQIEDELDCVVCCVVVVLNVNTPHEWPGVGCFGQNRDYIPPNRDSMTNCKGVVDRRRTTTSAPRQQAQAV
eukprot:scaffold13340_cov212-Alexandrium_tamarense.AAC.17